MGRAKKKKGPPRRAAFESFRRGCLKGTFFVHCGISFRKCEMIPVALQFLQLLELRPKFVTSETILHAGAGWATGEA
jgi:hypothetical protein